MKTYEINFSTTSADIPRSSGIRLDTSGLNEVFPGLEEQYGANLTVDVEQSVNSLSNFTVREGNSKMAFDSDMDIKLWVNFANQT